VALALVILVVVSRIYEIRLVQKAGGYSFERCVEILEEEQLVVEEMERRVLAQSAKGSWTKLRKNASSMVHYDPKDKMTPEQLKREIDILRIEQRNKEIMKKRRTYNALLSMRDTVFGPLFEIIHGIINARSHIKRVITRAGEKISPTKPSESTQKRSSSLRQLKKSASMVGSQSMKMNGDADRAPELLSPSVNAFEKTYVTDGSRPYEAAMKSPRGDGNGEEHVEQPGRAVHWGEGIPNHRPHSRQGDSSRRSSHQGVDIMPLEGETSEERKVVLTELNLEHEMKSIFLFKKRSLYFLSVEVAIMFNCLYMAFIFTSYWTIASLSSKPELYKFLMVAPLFITFPSLGLIVSTSSKILAISKLNVDIIAKVLSEDEESMKLL